MKLRSPVGRAGTSFGHGKSRGHRLMVAPKPKKKRNRFVQEAENNNKVALTLGRSCASILSPRKTVVRQICRTRHGGVRFVLKSIGRGDSSVRTSTAPAPLILNTLTLPRYHARPPQIEESNRDSSSSYESPITHRVIIVSTHHNIIISRRNIMDNGH